MAKLPRALHAAVPRTTLPQVYDKGLQESYRGGRVIEFIFADPLLPVSAAAHTFPSSVVILQQEYPYGPQVRSVNRGSYLLFSMATLQPAY